MIFSACSHQTQPTQQTVVDKDGNLTLETAYILYVVDKKEKKYKFKLDRGHTLQIKNGIKTYKHPELGEVKVIRKVKFSQRVIGGGWDHSDALSF